MWLFPTRPLPLLVPATCLAACNRHRGLPFHHGEFSTQPRCPLSSVSHQVPVSLTVKANVLKMPAGPWPPAFSRVRLYHSPPHSSHKDATRGPVSHVGAAAPCAWETSLPESRMSCSLTSFNCHLISGATSVCQAGPSGKQMARLNSDP